MITKINGVQNNYLSQNTRISFKSKIVPNKTIKDIFTDAKMLLKILNTGSNKVKHDISVIYTLKSWFNAMKDVLNDGKNDLVEFIQNKNGKFGYKLNGKKGKIPKTDMLKANSEDVRTITDEEFEVINSAISKLKDDLNADYESKNLDIIANLHKNMQEIDKIFLKYTADTLDKLEKQIFKNK